MSSVKDDVVIITGASRGLGESMAKRFGSEGARIVLAARTRSDLEEVADEIDSECLVHPTDVTSKSDVRELVDATVDTFGRVDTLINNAGIGLLSLQGEPERILDVSLEDWNKIISTNVTGPFLCTQAVLPQMIDQERGNIINISSGLGRDVYTIGGSAWAPYTVSKWGLEALTQVTAHEFEGTGINANSLDPGGAVDTKFWDHLSEEEREEIMSPDVMDDAAVLLASQGSDGISGESMNAEAWEERLG